MPTPALPSYNIAPSPSAYSPVFGGVPGTVGAPPSTYQQVQGVVPTLPQLTTGTANAIQSQVAGQLSPETISNIQNQSAAWGLSMGVPGSQLASNMGLRNIGLTTEGLQQSGINDYLKFLTGVSSTMNNPALLSDIAEFNAVNAAAPNPAAANEYLMSLLNPPNTSTEPAMSEWFTPAGSDPNVTKMPIPRM